MSDLIREIDEEVAKDRSEEFFEKWGWPFLIFVLIVVAGLFFFFMWQTRSETSAQARADNLAIAIAQLDDDPVASQLLLEELESAPGGYGQLAQFNLPKAYWNQGDAAKACDGWSNYANKATNNENLQNSARFHLAWHCHGVLQVAEIAKEIEILEGLDAYTSYTPILKALAEAQAGNIDAAQALLEETRTAEDTPLISQELAGTILGLTNGL